MIPPRMSPLLAMVAISAMVGAAADAPLPRYRSNEPPPEPECKSCSRSSKGKCRKHRDEVARRAIMEST